MILSVYQSNAWLLALAIMTFHASHTLGHFNLFVTRPPPGHFDSPSNIFSHCFTLLPFPSILLLKLSLDIPNFQLLCFHTRPKKDCLVSDILLSASCNTALFDFFAVHEISSIPLKNQTFPWWLLKIVQAPDPYTRLGTI